MNEFEKFLAEKGISKEDFAKKTPQEMAQLHSEFSAKQFKALEEQIGKAATPEQLKEAQDSVADLKKSLEEGLKGLVKEDEFKKVKKSLEDAEAEVKALKETGTSGKVVDFKSAVAESLKEQHDELKEFMADRKKGGYFSIDVKVPAAVGTGNITTDATPAGYAAANATNVSDYIREQIYIEQYLSVGSTDQASIPYVDETAGEGDAAMVAEGGLKPLIDADYNTKYSQAKKVAGRMKASEESLSDFKWLLGKLTTTLKRKHDIARQRDILSGPGTGPNLLGITNMAIPFNPAMLGSLADTFPQEGQPGAANNYDVIAVIVNAVITQSEGTFIPNVALVNNIDTLKMKLTKDSSGRYLLPPFMDATGNLIDGVQVVAQPSLPAGTFIIGDLKNVQLDNVWGYTVRFGWENDDFSKNMITMIGESRLHLYISENDKRGIISGDFATVRAALNAPAPV